MFKTSKYTWIVSQGAIVGDSSGMVGMVGPKGAKNHARFDRVIQSGRHFRMLHPDGQMRYSGYILGEFTGFEPLDEYGAEKGCVAIEYERGGEWIRLEPTGDDS